MPEESYCHAVPHIVRSRYYILTGLLQVPYIHIVGSAELDDASGMVAQDIGYEIELVAE